MNEKEFEKAPINIKALIEALIWLSKKTGISKKEILEKLKMKEGNFNMLLFEIQEKYKECSCPWYIEMFDGEKYRISMKINVEKYLKKRKIID